MFLMIQHSLLLLFLVTVTTCRSFSMDLVAVDASPINQIANVTYGEIENHSSLTSIFSPRMDFEQWKPLTGRGDPLRNDPTYDYEPPVLERVHYWADETRLEREHYPERKSEVLMLGVSSRKPSVTRQPPLPPRRHVHRPQQNKYEDFTYKLSDHYPMTILVPPPPPPTGHQPPLFILPDDKLQMNNKAPPQMNPNNSPQIVIKESTPSPERLTSSYALQESNLIYQSSTIQNWIRDSNDTKTVLENAVSSDYAGWGPTTPVDDNDSANDTHNLILNEHAEFSRHPYSFYKPMLSESPPSPNLSFSPLIVPTFVPTALPPTTALPTMALTQVAWPTERTTEMLEVSTETPLETTTEKRSTIVFQPTSIPTTITKLETSMFDMLGPMMSMPMVNGPERPEDNLYAHASDTVNIFNEHKPGDLQIETMQTMQPPPPLKPAESSTLSHKPQFHVNSQISNKKPALYTHGPYLHKRFTTPIPTTVEEFTENLKSTTEAPTVPMYLIIQGHSKVKTYSSKPKYSESNETLNNEISNSKHLETNEVKHLHPITKKSAKTLDLTDGSRKNKAKNLKTLIDSGHGSIEIQETNLGIKYDVSDGSDVPIEIYRKGIVDSDENSYLSSRKTTKEMRSRRQIELEDLLPLDEEVIEEYVYNFLEGRKNETGIAGLIAQAVTSDAASAVDELEDEDESDQEEER